MNDQMTWVATRARWAWAVLASGVVAGVAGAIAEVLHSNAQYNFRVLTGVGILLAVVGIERVMRCRAALKDEQSARRLMAHEHDERTVMIRSAAGYRAYVASAILVYAGLMWVSLASNGRLPELEGDVLWYFLAAGVLIPAGVYVGSMAVDERRS